ncbi:MAG: nucleotide exchange factor GrpE [Candidatus Methanoplasma sp.]|jgi:molecular chaperone GrpE (heat shock protein)|nr:nucleotide exchange factor GrpE [Candidatus Methanoplasma sp.]
MTEKKFSKTSKLKNFLATGSTELKEEPEQEGTYEEEQETVTEEEFYVEDVVVTSEPIPDPWEETVPVPEEEPEAEIPVAVAAVDTSALEREVAELREVVTALSSEISKYATTKEQLKEYAAVVSKRDTELANRKLMGMLEQLSTMREDFFKLCKGVEGKLDSFSAKDVLNSFEAYGVDMENILSDCGVFIGPFQYDRLNTMHQRIVDVIPTEDESLNGKIAERVSNGYEYGGRVLFKERVNIYKFTEKAEEKAENEEERRDEE